MTVATRDRAPAHARIYSSWVNLPTWRALSPNARCLLVEMLARFRPGENGKLEWPVRSVADVLGVSKATGARVLIELERNGWLKVVKVSAFGGRASPARYALTMFADDTTGEPPSRAFEYVSGEASAVKRTKRSASQSHKKDKLVPVARRDGFTGGTRQSHGADKKGVDARGVVISDLLRNTRFFGDESYE
jgi:hypothetical protein